MNEMEPDAEFLGHLEWQVRTAARREQRFAKAAPARSWRVVRAAAVIVFALALGAGGVFAAERWQQSREAGLRTAQWEVRRALASTRLRSMTQDRDEARARFEAGAAGQEELLAAERERVRAERTCARLESEAAEVALTGAEPSDRISAPLVGGRDFVRERLEFAAGGAHADVEALGQLEKLADARFAAGVTTDGELREAQQALQAALESARLVAQRLELRARFVAGELSAIEAELRDMRLGAECGLSAQRAAVVAARADLARAETLVEAGRVPEQEFRRAQQELAEAEAALRLAQIELDMLSGNGQR